MDRDRVTAVTVGHPGDFDALGVRWRDLETRSSPSFFQSWTWTGCMAEERFPNPVLVEARENGRTVALALFNRRGRTLYLGESGDPALDCIYIEFNGVLAEAGRETELSAACLRAARGWTRRLLLAGVGGETVASLAAIGHVQCYRSMAAPFADLAGHNGCFMSNRSANTRQQLRRSDRDYARSGSIVIERAETLERAHEFLDELKALHQAYWTARGHPGAFAKPFFDRFHRALIKRALPLGEIDLFRISAGPRTAGFLYNFRHRGRSLAYQSGFDYENAGRHGKPGLTCHHQAIQYAKGWDAERYEFLAGDGRYKRSLSDGAETLHWVEIDAHCSPRVLARRVRDVVIGRWRER